MGHQPLNVGPEIASNVRKEDTMDMEEREREREREAAVRRSELIIASPSQQLSDQRQKQKDKSVSSRRNHRESISVFAWPSVGLTSVW